MGRNRASSGADEPGLDLTIPATPSVVSQVRESFSELGLDSALLEDARLLVTELVTNSIKHAGLGPEDSIQVRASWSGTRLRVEVHDHLEGPAARVHGSIRPPPGAESGWGLYLVDRLASRWGTARGRYWFELEEDTDRSP